MACLVNIVTIMLQIEMSPSPYLHVQSGTAFMVIKSPLITTGPLQEQKLSLSKFLYILKFVCVDHIIWVSPPPPLFHIILYLDLLIFLYRPRQIL